MLVSETSLESRPRLKIAHEAMFVLLSNEFPSSFIRILRVSLEFLLSTLILFQSFSLILLEPVFFHFNFRKFDRSVCSKNEF